MFPALTGNMACWKCGTALPADAGFCPKCGAPARKPRPKSSVVMWIPIAIIALGLLAFAVLTGMPFGGEPDRAPRVEKTVEVVEEAPPRPVTTTRPAPAAAAVPPLQVPELEPQPQQEPEGTLTEAQAIATLRAYITSRDDYGVSSSCLVISSQGYKNRGYTLEAFDRCGNDSVGRWRVDTLTGNVYRQRPDGRYLAP